MRFVSQPSVTRYYRQYTHALTIPSIIFEWLVNAWPLSHSSSLKTTVESLRGLKKTIGHLLSVSEYDHKNFKLFIINTEVKSKINITYLTNYSHKIRIVQLQSLFHYNTNLILFLYHNIVQLHIEPIDCHQPYHILRLHLEVAAVRSSCKSTLQVCTLTFRFYPVFQETARLFRNLFCYPPQIRNPAGFHLPCLGRRHS